MLLQAALAKFGRSFHYDIFDLLDAMQIIPGAASMWYKSQGPGAGIIAILRCIKILLMLYFTDLLNYV